MVSNLIEHEIADADTEQDDRSILESSVVKSPHRAASLKRRSGTAWLRIGFVALLVVTAFGVGWWVASNRAQQHERIELRAWTHSVDVDKAIVTVEPVTFRAVQRYIEAVGTLHGFEEVAISSKQEGRVDKIYHDLSSVVQPGQLLLELDPTDAKLAVEQSEQSLKTELARWGFTKVPSETDDLQQLPTVISARLKFELAQLRQQRMDHLKATNSVATEDLEQAKSDALVSESDWQNQLLMANAAAATARLRQAELAIANQRLKDIAIRAPVPSLTANAADQYYTISDRMVSEGTMVRPSTEVFRLVLGRTLKLKLQVPEALSRLVVVGQPVEVHSGVSETPSIGTVARISPAIDRATRTLSVEVDVANESGELKPGGFAKAKVLIGTDENAATIPIAGLYSFAGINKIFLDENGTARELKVTLGEQTAAWVEIASPDLPNPSMVVTSGQRLLSEGSSIAIRDTERINESRSGGDESKQVTARSSKDGPR
ncbi:MAG: efflux RND transporter periplasmic adaptor subunit [Pirellulaceae bacterium]|nr:efflux RND transporter periplasmic adaptor subunit [Pirellulaceae bacterium]